MSVCGGEPNRDEFRLILRADLQTAWRHRLLRLLNTLGAKTDLLTAAVHASRIITTTFHPVITHLVELHKSLCRLHRSTALLGAATQEKCRFFPFSPFFLILAHYQSLYFLPINRAKYSSSNVNVEWRSKTFRGTKLSTRWIVEEGWGDGRVGRERG